MFHPRLGAGFFSGDCLEALSSLRNCDNLWTESVSGLNTNSGDRFREDETSSSVSAETVSVEGLRQMVSNAAVLRMLPR